MKKALILYWTHSGNTEKAARAIEAGLKSAGLQVRLSKIEDAGEVDYFDYDLVCVGGPSYNWHVPKPLDEYLKAKFAQHKKSERVRPGSPRQPGKYALVFCTYSGPHTGIDEAIPAGKYMAQFFDHIGFSVLDEWYILSEFHGHLELSTLGRMGDIRGLPSEGDLLEIQQKAHALAASLHD